MKKGTEEYRLHHKNVEIERYWAKHKNDTGVCVFCGKTYLKIERRGTVKTCSKVCSDELKKKRDKNRDKEKRAAYTKKYYEKNKEHLLGYAKKYRQTDAGKLSMKNADLSIERNANKKIRYDLKREITGCGLCKTKEVILKLNLENVCVFCGSSDDLTIDHKTPISRNGSNEKDNLQVLCRKCNSRKKNMTNEEYFLYNREYKRKIEANE